MTMYCFKAQAMTPVHVGSGNEIDPLQFVLQGNRLLHFNPADVLNRLSPGELNRYMEVLERADLKAIQGFLRGHIDPQHLEVVDIQVSEAFRHQFERRAASPDKSFRVDMMPRNPHSGRAYLPGSSIKGAIRTALVNYFANLRGDTRSRVHGSVAAAGAKDKGKVLEEAALNRRQAETERDVLRLLDVEDVALPDSVTRIDRAVHLGTSGRTNTEQIQIWVERLKSWADSWDTPGFSVNLHLDQSAMGHNKVKALLGRTLDFDTILKACNQFYWGRMQAEGDKFDGRASGGRTWQVLHGLFPRGKTSADAPNTFAIDPDTPYWCNAGKKRFLLRVGRFSHFESLSVDELRQGYNIQRKLPIQGMGAARTRCDMGTEKPPMPFGWLMLTLGP